METLRILAIVNLPWDRRLGAARVWIELTEEWRRAGHEVEVFCLTNAFPRPTSSGALSKIRQALFPSRAAAFVRRNAARFDVIDCLIGTLPYSKRRLGFRGLFVARSVGLFRLYEEFMEEARRRWPEPQQNGSFFGGIFHRWIDRHFWKSAEASLKVCDLVNVPNESEREALRHDPRLRAPVVVQPYGLRDEFREALAHAAAPAEERRRRLKVCFIGMWSLRKGSRDWPKIMATIWRKFPAAEFVLLGTMFAQEVVLAELGRSSGRVTCLPTYPASELPSLLADCTLALFPSYIEGFGLAVIEQLAAGLPTIAYDVPGPRQILPPHLLTPAGAPEAMAARALEMLALPLHDYEQLASDCHEIAGRYRWEEIAAATARDYRAALDSLGK